MPRGYPVNVDVPALARDYRAGSSIRTLANRYRASYGTIRCRLIDFGVRLRPCGLPRGKRRTPPALT